MFAWNRSDSLQSQSWTLTKAGDWQQFIDTGVTHNRTHNSVHELTADNAAVLSFDAKGNLLSNAINDGSFTWDFDNQLQQATISGTTAAFASDALGRRVTKAVGGASTVYVSSLAGESVPGSMVAEYQLGAAPASPARTHVYGECEKEPLGIFASGVAYHYHFDARGSARAITAGDGTVREFYAYTAYGATTILAANGTTVLTASQVGNANMFAGRAYDAEIGLYYWGDRYFDPRLGRYLSRDPLDDADDLDFYEFAEEPPCMLVGALSLEAHAAAGGWAADSARGGAVTTGDPQPKVKVDPRLKRNPPPKVDPRFKPRTPPRVKPIMPKRVPRPPTPKPVVRTRVPLPKVSHVTGVATFLTVVLWPTEIARDEPPWGWDLPPVGPRRMRRCRCTIRHMPDPDREACNCPDRVYGWGLTMRDCQANAKETAPEPCRAYYGHCGWVD